MDSIKSKAEDKMKKTLATLGEEFVGIRTGRASAAIFEKIHVDYFGQSTPLNQVATVSVPEARLVVIQPWDKSVINDIEKAIQKSELSLNPNNDGKVIRINIPPLTEQRRKELVKTAKNVAEKYRVAMRNIRRDANDELKKQLKASEITEDQEKQAVDYIQKITDNYINDINKKLESKEKEIMEI
ncbi:MAG: ribosome recycling factor [Spirochaetaceae bacterium]|nr:ribosome recycling factor [Spirochaetaceae bacterium]